MASEVSDCPQCEADHERRIELLKIKHRDGYGKISKTEYDELTQQIATLTSKGPPQDTMEENYEHWFADGKFKRRYNCKCEKCGFDFTADTIEEECEIEVDDDELFEEEDDD